jgi:hypothetical protein
MASQDWGCQVRTEVLARRYVRAGGHCLELIKTTPRARYHVARDGWVQDARKTLKLAEAQEFYDSAPYHLGARPGGVK